MTRPLSGNSLLFGQVLASTVLEGDRAEGWQRRRFSRGRTPPSQNRRLPWVEAQREASERPAQGDVGAGGLARASGPDPAETAERA